MDLEQFLKDNAQIINKELETLLKVESAEAIDKVIGKTEYEYDEDAVKKSVFEPALYLFRQGGKRWRPALTMLILQALGKDSKNYAEFALIPEFMHTATVIHDDIEDNSPMRRGVPSMHIQFGLDIANNLGDFMYFFPMRILVNTNKLDAITKSRVMASYINNMTKITVGQATDIAWHRGLVDIETISEDNYMQMAVGKTGIVSRLACEIGGIIAGVDDSTVEKLGKFGATIGVAFQIQDDILNLIPSGVSETKGGVGEDITEGKGTMLIIYALQHLDVTDKKRLKEIMSMHTNDKEIIKEGINLIIKSGAIENAKRVEETLFNDAWEDVEKALPDSNSKILLKDLASFLIARTK